MAIRTAEELIGSVRGILGEQTPDGYLELLEDITDSVGARDTGDMVSRAEYDALAKERDDAIASRNDIRTRYINRFYSDYNDPNDKGLILGEAPQQDLEDEEEDLSYESLFE